MQHFIKLVLTNDCNLCHSMLEFRIKLQLLQFPRLPFPIWIWDRLSKAVTTYKIVRIEKSQLEIIARFVTLKTYITRKKYTTAQCMLYGFSPSFFWLSQKKVVDHSPYV